MIGLVVRYPTGEPFPKESLSQNVLFCNPQVGMALIHQDYRIVKKVGAEFLEALPTWTETKWEEFKEAKPRLWLPTRYWSGVYEAIQFPKSGTKYPPGFQFDKAYLGDYRLETFLRLEFRARVIDMKVGQEFETDAFKLELPKAVIVRDTTNDRMYQTSDMIPLTLEADMRQAYAASHRQGYGVWIWLAVANVLLLGALGVWLLLRRRRAKVSPHKGLPAEADGYECKMVPRTCFALALLILLVWAGASEPDLPREWRELQIESNWCGAKCLWLLAKGMNKPYMLDEVKSFCPAGEGRNGGLSLDDLRQGAQRCGLSGMASEDSMTWRVKRASGDLAYASASAFNSSSRRSRSSSEESGGR